MTLYGGTVNNLPWPMFFSNRCSTPEISVVDDGGSLSNGDISYTNETSFTLFGVIALHITNLDYDAEITVTTPGYTYTFTHASSSLSTLLNGTYRTYPVILKPGKSFTVHQVSGDDGAVEFSLQKMSSNITFNYSQGEYLNLSLDSLYSYQGLLYGYMRVTVPQSTLDHYGLLIDLFSDESGSSIVETFDYRIPIDPEITSDQYSYMTFYLLIPPGWSWKLRSNTSLASFTPDYIKVAYIRWW